MANNKKLDSIVQINGDDYAVIAEEAKKVQCALTIKDGSNPPKTFDGSTGIEIETNGGNANKIQVNLDNNKKEYATITISKNDPTAGTVGDIWFKYI